MLKIGLFAGSFDPFTLGHLDIVERAAKLFDKIFIGVAKSTGAKTCKLSLSQRLEIVKKSVSHIQNVSVESFDSFLVDYAVSVNADSIVRGLRTSNDFEYEKALTEVYKSQNNKIETLYLISSHNYSHVSGSVVRELATLGGSLKGYVAKNVEEMIKNLFSALKKS